MADGAAGNDTSIVLSIVSYFVLVFILFGAFGIANVSFRLPTSPKGVLGNGTSENATTPQQQQQGFLGAYVECIVTSVGLLPLAVLDAFFVDVPWVNCTRSSAGAVGGVLAGIGDLFELIVFIIRLVWDFLSFLWQFTTFGYPQVPAFVTVLFAWMPALTLVFVWVRTLIGMVPG